MKKKLIILISLFVIKPVIGQNISDIGRIILNSVVIDPDVKVAEENKSQLLAKLNQIATNNGIGGNSLTPRFVIAAKVNTISKNIVAGPPQSVALTTEFVFYIGDALDNKVFATNIVSARGVGVNEVNALTNAIQQINFKSTLFSEFVNNGKNAIIDYYSRQCDMIIIKVSALTNMQQYEAAIYELLQVPNVSKECYEKSMSLIKPIYQDMIDKACITTLNTAKLEWSKSQNKNCADEVGILLASINSSASCYKDALKLSEEIRIKIQELEKQTWEFNMKKYVDEIDLKKNQLNAAKQIAIQYYKTQPNVLIHNYVGW